MKRYAAMIAFVVITVHLGSRCTSEQKSEEMPVIISKDRTAIAYEKTGQGPAVILVGGALSSGSDFSKHAKRLSANFTVYQYDRRGRGESGNTKPYSVNHEIEDIEALIDQAGGSANIFGISSGACLALEAASALGEKVKKLAIYEAPYDEAEGAAEKWKEYRDQLDRYISADRREDAVEYHLRFVGVPDAALLAMKASPNWSTMKSLAPTLPYDVAIVGEDRSVPVERIKTIKAKTLVLDGGASAESMPFMRVSADKIAQAIPNAQRKTIEGEAHNVSEKALAPVLISFFQEN